MCALLLLLLLLLQLHQQLLVLHRPWPRAALSHYRLHSPLYSLRYASSTLLLLPLLSSHLFSLLFTLLLLITLQSLLLLT